MRRALFLLAAMAAIAVPAAADPWQDIDRIDDTDLAQLRGGIAIGPNLNVSFGAVVTTFANGMPVLQTNLNWSETGAVVSQTMNAANEQLSALSSDQLEALGIESSGGAAGVVLNDEHGVTTLVHNLTESSLQNIILNEASGRDLSQNVDVTITLPGFEALQGALDLERFGLRLDADMRALLADGV